MPPALVATAPQGMWVRLSISQDWLPGEKRTFYLYSYFALAANTNIRVCWPVASCVHAAQQACRVATRWSQSFFICVFPEQPSLPCPLPGQLQMQCIPYASWNPGVVCESVQLASKASSTMQIAVT